MCAWQGLLATIGAQVMNENSLEHHTLIVFNHLSR